VNDDDVASIATSSIGVWAMTRVRSMDAIGRSVGHSVTRSSLSHAPSMARHRATVVSWRHSRGINRG